MIEQSVEIHFKDIGILTFKPRKYYANSCPLICCNMMKLFNVPEFDVLQKIPIQYHPNPSNGSANIILQEETRYNIIFKSENSIDNLDFPTLELYEKDFTFSKFSIDSKTYVGELNTGSYVGKSFFDVEFNGIKSIKVPFDVRPRKMNSDHYAAMISDLCETASGIVFDSSPVFEHHKLSELVRKTFYEDFIFLEYLFRPENLISAYEHIRRDPHKILQRYQEPVPLPFSSSAGPSELISMVSDSGNLNKTENIPPKWPENMKGYVPKHIDQSYFNEVVDNPENRFVKYFLQLLGDLFDELLNYITEEGIEGYTVDKIHDFHIIVQEYLLDGWLEEVGEMKFFPSNSQVLQKKSGYRDILKFYMVLESSFFINMEDFDDLLKGYQRKLFDLYEYWCYIKLFDILCKMAKIQPDYNRIFDKSSKKEWSIKLKTGERSKQHFEIENKEQMYDIELRYNRRFRRNKNPYRSYSLEFRPDYTISIKQGLKEYLLHLDAKYRSDIILEDVDIINRDNEEDEQRVYKSADVYKMHTYKDAINNSLGAYVLYPGNKPRIFREKPPNQFPSVGAFPLTPGDNLEEENVIEKFIFDILCYLNKQMKENYLLL